MKTRLLLLCLFAVFSLQHVFAQEKHVDESFRMPAHPRILLMKGEEQALKRNIFKDAIWTDVHKSIIKQADDMLDLPVEERIKQGKRLLQVSQSVLKRVFFWSYAYRMTGNMKYVKRAEKEMLKAASFSDWNPSHFLDTGEMTMALAIGYDWLYDRLPASTKKIIEEAILEKGFKPSYDYSGIFYHTNSNWNQVCNGGLSYGALAIWDKAPKESEKIINRAIETITRPMDLYAPDGAYPEGASYWSYGTTFNTLFLSAIERIFKTDFGLSAEPGFLNSSQFLLHMTTPALNVLCHSDSGSKASFQGALYWFYQKTKDPSILYWQSRLYERDGVLGISNARYAPAILVWGASYPISKERVEPKTFAWHGGGINPVYCVRSDWSDNGTYLGVKFGTPSYSHGHMDAGSFTYENDKVKWAYSMGSDNYLQLESAGVDLWNLTQNSSRWDAYRYNNLAHNTLAFNRKHQVTTGSQDFASDTLRLVGLGKMKIEKGYCKIDNIIEKANQSGVVSDMTPLYYKQVEKVRRGVSLVDKKVAVIEDEVMPGKNFTMLTWSMVTEATPKVLSDNLLLLEKDGKKLYLKVESKTPIRWNNHPAVSDFTFDSPNPGITIVSFDTDLKLGEKQNIKVFLIPDENKEVAYTSVM